MQRQAQQARGGVRRPRTAANRSADLPTTHRRVQSDIVRAAVYFGSFQMGLQSDTLLLVWQHETENMSRRLAVGADGRQAKMTLLLQCQQTVTKLIEALDTLTDDCVAVAELRGKHRGTERRHGERRSVGNPLVVKYVSAHKGRAIGATLDDTLGGSIKRGIVDEEGTTFAAREILGRVKRIHTKVTNRSECSSTPRGTQCVRRILDEQNAARLAQRQQRGHVARIASIVHNNNSTSAWRDGGLHMLHIDAQIVADIDKHNLRAT